jgi:hypothetical protein
VRRLQPHRDVAAAWHADPHAWRRCFVVSSSARGGSRHLVELQLAKFEIRRRARAQNKGPTFPVAPAATPHRTRRLAVPNRWPEFVIRTQDVD